jgi:hypothetical protein
VFYLHVLALSAKLTGTRATELCAPQIQRTLYRTAIRSRSSGTEVSRFFSAAQTAKMEVVFPALGLLRQ